MIPLLALAVAFQVYLLTRCPAGLASESILAAQAMMNGQMPYRDFKFHSPPLMMLVYAALFSIPPLVWCSMVGVVANLITAFGIYILGMGTPTRESDPGKVPFPAFLPAALYLLCVPFFGGNEGYLESVMTMFGIWAFVFAGTNHKWWAGLMVVLATMTKQTGIFYVVCFL